MKALKFVINGEEQEIPQGLSEKEVTEIVDERATVISGDEDKIYTIKVSNTAPASGTPNTTITFRYYQSEQ